MNALLVPLMQAMRWGRVIHISSVATKLVTGSMIEDFLKNHHAIGRLGTGDVRGRIPDPGRRRQDVVCEP